MLKRLLNSGSRSAPSTPKRTLKGINLMRKRSKSQGRTSHDQASTSACWSDGLRLTDRERVLLQETWALNVHKKPPDAPGRWIFRRVFSRKPQMMSVFGLTNVPVKKLEDQPIFLHHAQVFSNFLNQVIINLDALDTNFEATLLSLGARHVSFDKYLEIKAEYWEEIAETMCAFATHWSFPQKKTEIKDAWKTLVYFVAGKIRQGYEQEKMRTVDMLNYDAL